MPIITRDTTEVLNREFLVLRGKILEVAAALDRLDRAPEHPGHHPDPRLGHIRQALEALQRPEATRAETVQHLFSREYDPAWRTSYDLPAPRF